MSHEGKLVTEPRAKLGSRNCQKLRATGRIPACVYGHNEPTVSVSLSEEDVTALVHAGTRVVSVEVEGKSSKALVREVQWDTLGLKIHHVDLLRVDPNQRLTLEVHVELKGTAPGVLSGGVLDHEMRSLTVECPVIAIPDSIIVKVGHLEIGGVIHVREVEAPPNTKILNPPDLVVVQVKKKVEEDLLLAPAAEGAEQPELIRKPKEEEGAEAEAGATPAKGGAAPAKK
jgi:large subunit ribosomal protein L25